MSNLQEALRRREREHAEAQQKKYGKASRNECACHYGGECDQFHCYRISRGEI